MNLKFFATITICCSFIVYIVILNYAAPLVLLPQSVTTFEFVSYTLIGYVLEAALIVFLFIHMLVKSKIDFSY